MGLAQAKNKHRFGDDPNNTRWARNTDTFGQKILRSHGWEPGQYLGPTGAPHAEFHSAASASYIRTVLREDNLGIGATRSGNNTADQCTGLDVFKDLLGRLNGTLTEEVLEKRQKVREDANISRYIEQRFGRIQFVPGGMLVGNDMLETEEVPEILAASQGDKTAAITEEASEEASKAARKKAKRERRDEERLKKKDKGEKKAKKRKTSSDAGNEDPNADERQTKRRKKTELVDATVPAPETANAVTTKAQKETKDKKEKKTGKMSKKTGKKDKRERKEKKDKKRRKKASSDAEADGELADIKEPVSTPLSGSQTPPLAGAYPPPLVSNRHLARRRYIAQKRAALMDPQALKQIFMIKT